LVSFQDALVELLASEAKVEHIWWRKEAQEDAQDILVRE
jgi:hypothetical protein